MKIKTKLRLGTGILFAMVAILAVLGVRQVNILSADSEKVLEDNYNSLEYSVLMLRSLDQLKAEPDVLGALGGYLQSQQKNITEVGEKELTDRLVRHYGELRGYPGDSTAVSALRADINKIMELNLSAIDRKSQQASRTARESMVWIAIAGTICFLIALTLFVNLPGNIANPIKKLTESIGQIADENYTERVHFGSADEYGKLAQSFNTMAEKLEEYSSSNVARLMTEKKRVETLINNMHDPVIGLDENKVIIFANEEAQKVTGLKAGELVGGKAAEVALHNDLVRALVTDAFALQNEKPDHAPMKIYADGKESYFEKENINISIIPTGERESRSIGNVIILRNVTPYKELDFAKTNFIANVSHELKTPISSIKISLDLLRNERVGSTNKDQKDLIESIQDDANRLLKITGELLNITQVESGHVQLNIANSSIAEILAYALASNEMQAESKGIEIRVSDTIGRTTVQADTEKTAWVLTNLISNAIRYSNEHSVIEIETVESGDFVHISVRDSGPGISQDYKDKIFDRYFRIPGSTKEGTGLGLAISREFMEAQDGILTVKSDLGAGSTFTIGLKKNV